MTLNKGNSRGEVFVISSFFIGLCIIFYIDGTKTTITDLSSDQLNILPVVIKIHDPSLYPEDLFADDIGNIKYYTPWFIRPLLYFSSLQGFDYYRGMNIFHFIVQLLYSFGWLILFRLIVRDIWIASFMTLLVRGILWPPGNELWGIAGLWTLLPRTVYLAFLPFGLAPIIYSISNRKPTRMILFTFLFLGIIGNFHPVSGLVVGFSILLTFYIYNRVSYKMHGHKSVKLHTILAILLLFLAGLFPFIALYVQQVIEVSPPDPVLFNNMLPLRIGTQFLKPLGVLKELIQLKWILFLFLPFIILLAIFPRLNVKHKEISIFSIILFFTILSISIVVKPVEDVVNNIFNLNIRAAFQLVRNVKYLLIPAYLIYAIIIHYLFGKFKLLFSLNGVKFISPAAFSLLLASSFLSRSIDFHAPIFSDDIIRGLLPDAITPFPYTTNKDIDLNQAVEWIRVNTLVNATFVGPPEIRAGAMRSLIYDKKGASMLIEGNPDRFVEWGRRTLLLNSCINIQQRAYYYSEWGAQYLLTTDNLDAPIIKQFGSWTLYTIENYGG